MISIPEIRTNGTLSFLSEYAEQQRWVFWKYGPGKTKVPYNPATSRKAVVTNPKTWSTFDAAAEAARTHSGVGIGIVLNGDGLVCVDLDDCRDQETGEVNAFAQRAVELLDAPTEVSVSGTGLHIWVRAHLPPNRPSNKTGTLEVYSGNRFMVLTGNCPTDGHLPNRSSEVLGLLSGDFEVLDAAINEDDEVADLMNGEWSHLPGIGEQSPSEADFVLLRKLTGYTDDPDQLRRLFLRSGLASNIGRHPNPEDYLSRTIGKALQQRSRKRGRPRKETFSREDAKWEVVTLDTLEMEPTLWVWENRIPLGAVSEIIGDPDVGKSTLAFDIAARVTQGKKMPDGSLSDSEGPGDVLILSAEDDTQRTLVPRLLAAGADLGKVHTLRITHSKLGIMQLAFPDDVERMRDMVRELGVKLIVIDPLVSYLDAKTDSHRDAQVRQALSPLAELAQTEEIAVLAIRHLNKNSQESNAKYRGGGSIGFTAMARTSLLAGRLNEDPSCYVLATVKNNLGPRAPSWKYQISVRELGKKRGKTIMGSYVDWIEETSLTDEELLNPKRHEQGTVIEQAREIIYPLLEQGPEPVSVLKEQIEEEGLSWSTVSTSRNKRKLGIETCRIRDDNGKKTVHAWRLPLIIESVPTVGELLEATQA